MEIKRLSLIDASKSSILAKLYHQSRHILYAH